jgi:putative methyltransferase (TIGR04325 family)
MVESIALQVARDLPAQDKKKFIAALEYRDPPPFEGVYASFGDVPGVGTFAQSAMWEDQQRYVVRLSRAAAGPAGMRRLIRSKALLPATVAFLARQRQPVRILDFGGGGGQDFGHLLLSADPASDLTYHVIDTANICAIGREAWADDPRITFDAELPREGTPFDLVYAFSSIQYVEDTDGLMRRFASFRPRAILLMAHPMADEAFVRKQTNMDVAVPQVVVSLPQVREVLGGLGYNLAMRGWSETDLNVDNYEEAHRVPGDANLLFLASP